MELLAASGANLNVGDHTQSTLLMYFARRGHAKPVERPRRTGDRNARNKSGKTAAEIGHAYAGILRLLTR